MDRSRVIEQLRWYLGRADVDQDAARVASGMSIALIGGTWDDLVGFADRLAPERPVVDLNERTPSARELRALFAEHPDTFVLAHRPERVIGAIGLIAQPWYLPVLPLTSRPQDALPLLRQAIEQLGVTRPLETLGSDLVSGFHAYRWPRGLQEIREVARRVGAVLDGGNVSAGARRLDVSRQTLAKYLDRRTLGELARES